MTHYTTDFDSRVYRNLMQVCIITVMCGKSKVGHEMAVCSEGISPPFQVILPKQKFIQHHNKTVEEKQ